MKNQGLPPLPVNDCWNSSTGMRGDRSCEKLREYIHCRNCDVYADAAHVIMQRALPVDYRSDWAAHFAAPRQQQRMSDESALVFRLGCEWLCLPARLSVTIAETATPHRLPHRDSKILMGIVNVKGKLYPCVSLAALMGIDTGQAPRQAARHVYPRLLVMQLEQHAFALPVQDLYGIHRYARADLLATPATADQAGHRYLTGILDIEDMKVGCLDADLIGYQLANALL